MTDIVVFILTTLAAYRLWRLWALDSLPPLAWARNKIGDWVEAHHGPVWAEGSTCPWCAGFWISAATVAAVWAYRPLPLPALWFAAVSALVGLLAQHDKG